MIFIACPSPVDWCEAHPAWFINDYEPGGAIYRHNTHKHAAVAQINVVTI